MSDQPVARRPKRMDVSERVLIVLKQHANIIMSMSEIATESGLERHAISSAIVALRKSGLNIDTPMRGQYIYHAGKRQEIVPRTGQLFEVVGMTRGYTIVRDESGELFILSPLANLIPKDRP